MQPAVTAPAVIPVATSAPWGLVGTASGVVAMGMASATGVYFYRQLSQMRTEQVAMEETLKTALETLQDQSEAYGVLGQLNTAIKRQGTHLRKHEETLMALASDMQALQDAIANIEATLEGQQPLHMRPSQQQHSRVSSTRPQDVRFKPSAPTSTIRVAPSRYRAPPSVHTREREVYLSDDDESDTMPMPTPRSVKLKVPLGSIEDDDDELDDLLAQM